MSMKFLLLCLTSLWALAACQPSSTPEQGVSPSSPSSQQVSEPSASSQEEQVEETAGTEEDEETQSEPADTNEEDKNTTDEEDTSSMLAVDQLLEQDLTSLAGTWTNAAGESLVINPQGIEGITITDVGQSGDYVYFGFLADDAPNTTAGSGALVVIPSGVSYGSLADESGVTDYSDTSQTRLIVGHILPPAIGENSTDWVYYRQD